MKHSFKSFNIRRVKKFEIHANEVVDISEWINI